MAILHLLDSAMVGHGIVSFAGFLTICRVLVSRPHLNPHVRLFLLQVPHSLQWPTSHPSNREKTNTDNNLVYISPSLQNLYSSISLLLHFQIPKIKLYSPQDYIHLLGNFGIMELQVVVKNCHLRNLRTITFFLSWFLFWWDANWSILKTLSIYIIFKRFNS